jgi:hypothetical protein
VVVEVDDGIVVVDSLADIVELIFADAVDVKLFADAVVVKLLVDVEIKAVLVDVEFKLLAKVAVELIVAGDVELFLLSVVVSAVDVLDRVIDVNVLVEVEVKSSVTGSSAVVACVLAVVLISVTSGGCVSAIFAGFVTD